MKKILLSLICFLCLNCVLKSQNFPNVDSVKKFINDSIRSGYALKASTIKKAYEGIAKFLPDAVADTGSVTVKAHGMLKWQRSDSTLYVYDTITVKRWRKAVPGTGGSGGGSGITQLGLGNCLTRINDSTYSVDTICIATRLRVKHVADSMSAALTTLINGKQATLVSGTNIKTVNGNSLLGSGDVTISGGASSDSTLQQITENGDTTTFNVQGDSTRFYDGIIHNTLKVGDTFSSGRLFVYGTSISSGFNVEGFRYDSLYHAYFARRYGLTTVNRAIAGTTMVIPVSGDSSMVQRIYTIPTYTEGDWIFYEYGTNDAWPLVNPPLDTVQFKIDYAKVLDTTIIARGFPTNRIVVIGSPYLTEAVYALTGDFARAAQTVAESKGVYFVENYNYMIAHGGDANVSADSIHPTLYPGHFNMYQAMKQQDFHFPMQGNLLVNGGSRFKDTTHFDSTITIGIDYATLTNKNFGLYTDRDIKIGKLLQGRVNDDGTLAQHQILVGGTGPGISIKESGTGNSIVTYGGELRIGDGSGNVQRHQSTGVQSDIAYKFSVGSFGIVATLYDGLIINEFNSAYAKLQVKGTTNDNLIRTNPVINNVGIGIAAPDSSAILDISSTTKGVLFPRMNTTQQNAILLPAPGLIIFNTDTAAFRFYNGSAWTTIGSGGGGGGGGGGYTNLTQFVGQTPWRLFYSDGSGDVQELALGTPGQVLTSNTTTSAPSFQTPAGASNWTVSGSDIYRNSKVAIGAASIGVGQLSITRDNTDYVNTAGAGSALYFSNPNAAGQTVMQWDINGAMAGKFRVDNVKNINWISAANATNYGHNFWIKDDYDGSGVIKMLISNSGVSIGSWIQGSGLVSPTEALHVTGNIKSSGFVNLAEQSAPATPASNTVVVYPKSDGFVYAKDDAGTETKLSNEATTNVKATYDASNLTATQAGATYTTPGDGINIYHVSARVTVAAVAGGGVLTTTVAYTDETNTARTMTFFGMGSTSAGLTTTGVSNFAVMGDIATYPSTAITVTTTLTIGTATYNAGSTIKFVRFGYSL